MLRKDSGHMETKVIQVGNYRFTGKTLGKGTFAVVEEAIHIHLRVKVSVKTINLQNCNAYVLKHIDREANLLQQLDHPHIVQLFETMKYGNMYCLVTERLQGGDLCVYLQQQHSKHLNENRTRGFSRQITIALHYLHSKGIVHRDLKLENIMLDSQRENIKLIDFGLSKPWSMDCPLKTQCGSPQYCAPELFVHGTMYGPKVDMWALGVIMYTMAVGQFPFVCVPALLKVPAKRIQFTNVINNGLTQAHIVRIVNYEPEFIKLLKGLMNPNWEERFSVEDTIKNHWMSNKNHWVPVQYDTPDSHDLAKVLQKVCGKLEMTQDKVKSELKNRPSGEIAAFFNIMIHQYNFQNKCELLNFGLSTSRGKKPLPSSIYVSTTSTSTKNSPKIYNSKSGSHYINLAGGDWTLISQNGLLNNKITNSFPSETLQGKSTELKKIVQTNTKFKEKNSGLLHSLPHSNLKLKYPVCKLGTNLSKSTYNPEQSKRITSYYPKE